MQNLKVAELKNILELMNESKTGSKDVLINRIKSKVCSEKTPIKYTYIDIPFSDKDEAKTLGAKWSPDKKKWKIIDDPDNLKKFDKWLVTEDIYLIVSFEDKDKVKALGAKWNPTEKKWFVKATQENKDKFEQWIPNSKKPLVLMVDYIEDAFTLEFRDLKPTWDEYAGVWTVPDTNDNRIKFAKWLLPDEDIDIEFVRTTRAYLTELVKEIRKRKKDILSVYEKSGQHIALTHLTHKLDTYDNWYITHLPLDQKNKAKEVIQQLTPIIIEAWNDVCNPSFINKDKKYFPHQFSSLFAQKALIKNVGSYIYDIYKIDIGIIQNKIKIQKEFHAASKHFFLEADYVSFDTVGVYNSEYGMYEVADTPENRVKFAKYIKDDEPLTKEFIIATRKFMQFIADAIKNIKQGEYETGSELFNAIINNKKINKTYFDSLEKKFHNKAQRYIDSLELAAIEGFTLTTDADKYSDRYTTDYTRKAMKKPKNINTLVSLQDFKIFISSTIYHKFK